MDASSDLSPEDPDWRRNLRVVWAAQLLAVAGMALILPILPLLVRELGVEDVASVQRWSGAIFAAPFLFAALMSPIWGWVGDRSGRKMMVVRALVGLSIAVACMGFAQTPGQLLALRILQGMVSGFIPATIALVSSMAPRAQLGYALGSLSASQAGGVVLGPLMGGVLADAVGFRHLFFVTAGVEMAVAIAVILLVRERRGGERRQAPSMLANARWALQGPTRIAIIALFGTQLAILLVQPFFALFVESLGVGRERLSSTTGAIFGVTGLATLIMAPRWGKFGDHFGRRRALWIAMGGASIAFALQGVVQDVRVLFCLRLLQGGFVAGMLPALYATIASRTPESRRAGVVAFGASATLLGGLVGPILGGTLASLLGMRPVFWISTGVFMINAALTLRLPADGPPRVPGLRRSWELPTG